MSELLQQRAAAEFRTILIVEDDPSYLRLLEEAFAETDSDVKLHSVDDADSALDYLQRLQTDEPALLPDLALVDLHLPDRSGRELVEAIRTHPELGTLPIVILTHSSHDSDIQRCYEAQANAYLTKPADFDELVSLVDSLETFWFDLAMRPKRVEKPEQAPHRHG